MPGLDARELCERSIAAGNVEIDPKLLTPSERETLIGLLLAALGVESAPTKRARKGAK